MRFSSSVLHWKGVYQITKQYQHYNLYTLTATKCQDKKVVRYATSGTEKDINTRIKTQVRSGLQACLARHVSDLTITHCTSPICSYCYCYTRSEKPSGFWNTYKQDCRYTQHKYILKTTYDQMKQTRKLWGCLTIAVK